MPGEYSAFGADEVLKLMINSGATPEEAEQQLRQARPKIDNALRSLAEHKFNTAAAGRTKVVIGHFQFQLRKAIISSIVISTAFAASGFALVGFPPAGVAGMAATVAAAIQQLSDQLKKLSDVEFLVYHMLLQDAKDHPGRKKSGSTEQEIIQQFRKIKQAVPPGIKSILTNLTNKNVLQLSPEGPETRYLVVH